MAFTEILKIIPKLDEKDLRAMEKSLQTRFTKIAKSFGKGLKASLMGGGIAGIALGLIDKLLNPIKEVQEAMDRALKSSDDLATNAKQFGTTTGKLAKGVALGQATGLEADNLYLLINKFQNAVAEAQQDPTKQSVVRNFTGEKDMVSAFFGFIQELQKMTKEQQLIVQQQVFGEKQILKMADFLQADFATLYAKTGLNKISSEKATERIDNLANLNDLQDQLTAAREFEDRIKKSGVIRESMVKSRDQSERLALQRENQRIAAYHSLATISQSVEKMMIALEKGVAMVGDMITWLKPFVDKVSDSIDKLLSSPMVRGVRGWFGGKGNNN